jgi:hypothetical protein
MQFSRLETERFTHDRRRGPLRAGDRRAAAGQQAATALAHAIPGAD